MASGAQLPIHFSYYLNFERKLIIKNQVSTYKFIFSNILNIFRDKGLKYMGNFFDTLPNPSLNPGLVKIAATTLFFLAGYGSRAAMRHFLTPSFSSPQTSHIQQVPEISGSVPIVISFKKIKLIIKKNN